MSKKENKADKAHIKKIKERRSYKTGLDFHDRLIKELSELCSTFEHRVYIKEMLTTIVKMGLEKTDNVDLKLVNSALKELRYSFSKFGAYRSVKKVTLFGSARSRPKDAEYKQAQEFARKIVKKNFMIITGAGPGIMEAGNKGASMEKSFGVNIKLPFEQSANKYIDGDPKLVNFKYFFTRKLTFIRESAATVVCPGGFGTLDEAFENITLFQTGKCAPRPIILLQPEGFGYWDKFLDFVRNSMLNYQFITEEDLNLFTVTSSVDEAVDVITEFYHVYHSIRNIGKEVVIRINRPISKKTLTYLNKKFSSYYDGSLIMRDALDEELIKGEFPELPRLVFQFKYIDFSALKLMIDAINKDDT